MNQTSAILAHLKSGQSISSMEAFELYGVTRLSAKIFELRKKGYEIKCQKRCTTNRFGHTSYYKDYYLEEEGD